MKISTTKTTLILVTMLYLTACGGGGGGSSSGSSGIGDQVQGVWEGRGYGYVIDVSGSNYTGYDFTSKTCYRHEKTNLDELVRRFDNMSADNESFTVRDAPTGFVDTFYRTEGVPAVCQSPIGLVPQEVFDHVWHTFNEYYAFFEERQVDWLAQYDATRDRVSNDMSEDALFNVLVDLVAPIDDVHVSIAMDDEQSYSPGNPKGFIEDFTMEFEAQSEIRSLEAYIERELGSALSIIDDVYLGGEFSEGGGPTGDFFKWGFIDDRIGYLSIGAFILQLDRAIADQYPEVEDVMDSALTDLASANSLIIDVRLSPGGADPIALAIANRFADAQRLAISKYSRSVEGEGEIQEAYVEPTSRIGFSGPVAVLTSGFSASATESFVLAMGSLPQVTVVGERTIGALSDILEKPLPNDWSFGLANEVYSDAQGLSFEALGIPPHIQVPAFAKKERDIGGDSALNAALSVLGANVANQR